MEGKEGQGHQSSRRKESPPAYSVLADRIFEGLSAKGDLDALIKDSKAGRIPLRDVANFTESGRGDVLANIRINEAGKPLLKDSRTDVADLCIAATNNLGLVIRHPERYGIDGAGLKFLEETSRLADGGMASALIFDRLFGRESGGNIKKILEGLENNPHGQENADDLIDRVISNPLNRIATGYFLADRSRFNEAMHNGMYGHLLDEVKNDFLKKFEMMARFYDLPMEHTERTLRQIEATRLSAYDPLLGGVTRLDSDSEGDYAAGTLRVEVKSGGTNGALVKIPDEEAREVLVHEVGHAGSAQPNNGCLGLSTNNNRLGVIVNEGFDDYVTRFSRGATGIILMPDRKFHYEKSYPSEVDVIHRLAQWLPKDYIALFHANFGYVRPELRNALGSFYRIYNRVAAGRENPLAQPVIMTGRSRLQKPESARRPVRQEFKKAA